MPLIDKKSTKIKSKKASRRIKKWEFSKQSSLVAKLKL